MNDSFIFVNKEKGFTSHDVVNCLRKMLSIRRIGHTGSLDPMAEGLLILCVGRATKLADDILSSDKVYEASIEFGYETDTLDVEGKVTKRCDNNFNEEQLIDSVNSLLKMKEQIPPIVSAIKVDGKRSYKRAFAGEAFELPKRKIEINSVTILDVKKNFVKIKINVSKGTYIRSIARDLGYSLGSYGTLTSLKRTNICTYSIENSFTLSEIKRMIEKDDFSFAISVENFYNNLDKLELTDKEVNKYRNGVGFESDKEGLFRIYNNNKFIGLGEVKEKLLKAYKYFKI